MTAERLQNGKGPAKVHSMTSIFFHVSTALPDYQLVYM